MFCLFILNFQILVFNVFVLQYFSKCYVFKTVMCVPCRFQISFVLLKVLCGDNRTCNHKLWWARLYICVTNMSALFILLSSNNGSFSSLFFISLQRTQYSYMLWCARPNPIVHLCHLNVYTSLLLLSTNINGNSLIL